MPQLAAVCQGHFKAGAIVTDVGSTKAELIAQIDALLAGSSTTFVGSHPIAGSEQAGLDAARPDLYDGATVVLTPSEKTPRAAVATVQEFWSRLGCRVSIMTPAEHDRVIARTSHLPHLLAAMLVETVCGNDSARVAEFCGAGFRDTTRIAAGSEDMWHDIVKSNCEAVRAALAEFGLTLQRTQALLDRNDFEGLRKFLAQSRGARRAIEKHFAKRSAHGEL
jgi:prephenate dehydrogenase